MPSYMVLFLYKGIPASAEVAIPAAANPLNQSGLGGNATDASITGLPNSSPLDMFPQVKFLALTSIVLFKVFGFCCISLNG